MSEATHDAAALPGPSEAAREAAANAPVGFARRKGGARGNIRKRAAEEEGDEGGPGAGGVQRKAQRAKEAPLAFTTKREDKFETFKFESSDRLQQTGDQGATRQLETETQHDRDARAQRERVLRAAAEGAASTAPSDEYKGMAGYVDYRAGFRREQTVGAEKGGGAHGPLRASTNVRMSIRIDYQPDICKDYKETGYCGYGDACKFLHDRGDYKAGWEIDRDWEQEQKEKRERLLAGWRPDAEDGEGPKSEEEEEDDLPFACFICRQPWEECQDPVVTRCKHYFCEQCALKQNAQSGKCFVCNQTTNGIFNVAHDIIRRTKQRQRKAAGGGGD